MEKVFLTGAAFLAAIYDEYQKRKGNQGGQSSSSSQGGQIPSGSQDSKR